MASPDQLLPEVREFLDADPIRMFVGGRWVPASGGGTVFPMSQVA